MLAILAGFAATASRYIIAKAVDVFLVKQSLDKLILIFRKKGVGLCSNNYQMPTLLQI
jgi:hypothetical protein